MFAHGTFRADRRRFGSNPVGHRADKYREVDKCLPEIRQGPISDCGRGIRKQSKSRCINRLKKYPSIRLRTEGLGLSTERFRRNIEVLRSFCRPASGKSKDRYYVFTTVAKDQKRAVPNSLIEKGV